MDCWHFGSSIRRTAVRHALLSYVFEAGIVATTVNLVASLTTHQGVSMSAGVVVPSFRGEVIIGEDAVIGSADGRRARWEA